MVDSLYNRRTMPTPHTLPDCHLHGAPIALIAWPTLSSEDLAVIVGDQQPDDALEKSEYCQWEARWVDLTELLGATQDGDAPDGGWSAAYLHHLVSDLHAVKGGSPEYAGRDAWIRDTWLADTRIYPLYLVYEWDEDHQMPRLRLLDGHRRLAGAFHYKATQVFSLVGTPMMLAPTE